MFGVNLLGCHGTRALLPSFLCVCFCYVVYLDTQTAHNTCKESGECTKDSSIVNLIFYSMTDTYDAHSSGEIIRDQLMKTNQQTFI